VINIIFIFVIGKDMILGLGNTSLLSQEILTSLNKRNIFFLYQAKGNIYLGTICSQWKESVDLGLIGDLEKE
jgi:hypothetical protein